MKVVPGPRRSRDAQTFVFFALTFGTILLLCGLAIDSGLLFLAKARMGRAVDGASLAAVGNFNASGGITNPTPQQIRNNVATIMRNFAVANFTDLGYNHTHYGIKDFPISSSTTEVASSYTTTTGQPGTSYTYSFNDGTKDANGAFRKYVEVVLNTGAGGQITSATCNARCPVSTFFIGAMAPFFRDLKVSASSVATRNPRLIVIVVDRSGSMLQPGGGAYGLPQAVVQFLDFFDTSSDYIGIVSFGSNARVEMPLTTNFIVAGTNILFDAYQTNATIGIPGVDPEEYSTNSDYDANYAFSGVRRLKFGGLTAADDGLRLGMEQLMANVGFNDPDVVKYLVLFTDGAWNQARTLMTAPPYTNIVLAPPIDATAIVTNTVGWSTNVLLDSNILPVPTLSPSPYVLSALQGQSQVNPGGDFANLASNHVHDVWQSTDGTNEPIVADGSGVPSPTGPFTRSDGQAVTVNSDAILYTNSSGDPVYARSIDVWLQPGAVDYEYTNDNGNPVLLNTYVSDLTNPTNHILIQQQPNMYNELVVPGYVADGLFFDELDLVWWDNSMVSGPTFPSFRLDNYNNYFMWPDDTTPIMTMADADAYGTTPNICVSLERQLMFRNYANLLTGFYISRADDPAGPPTDIDPYTGAIRPSYGLGPYYPGAGFYWPFDLVGLDVLTPNPMTNAAVTDPDPYQSTMQQLGGSRHIGYSINMQSAAAAPRWAGEWFYEGSGGTTNVSSPGNTPLSTLMTTKAQWQNGAPSWVAADFDAAGESIMTNESAHNTNVIPTADVWRPASFSGTKIGTVGALTAGQIVQSYNSSSGGSKTGGFVVDGAGNVYADSMAYSGRPTHYFDFSQSKWIAIGDQHNIDIQALPLGNWKAQEYAWHARNMGVTIYTVGYGYLVNQAQQVLLAQIANSTNTTAGNLQGGSGSTFFYNDGPGTAITYNPNQPIGQQFFATNAAGISNDFFQVGQAINAALTQ